MTESATLDSESARTSDTLIWLPCMESCEVGPAALVGVTEEVSGIGVDGDVVAGVVPGVADGLAGVNDVVQGLVAGFPGLVVGFHGFVEVVTDLVGFGDGGREFGGGGSVRAAHGSKHL